MSDWITNNEAVEIIRQRRATSEGHAKFLLREVCKTEVQTRPGPVLLLADDGIVGMDMRPGAQNKGVSHDLLYNKADLLHWLGQQSMPNKVSTRARSTRQGRPPSPIWEKVKEHVFTLLDYHGAPAPDDPKWANQAAVEKAATDFIENQGWSAAESTVREHVGEFIDEWKAGKADN
jgi:hypothetical protein